MLEQRAQQENAEIAWGDKLGLRCDAQVGRGYAPIGQTREIQLNTQRVSVNYLASVSNQAKVRFMLYTQKLTAQVFITFLERLIAKRERQLMWIVDRHPVHRSDAVHQWLQDHQDKIEMYLLPPYFPQLNPPEYLNCDVKPGVHSKPPTRSLSHLKGRLRASIQTPEITHSDCQVFPTSLHCLCCLNKCSFNYCRVNKTFPNVPQRPRFLPLFLTLKQTNHFPPETALENDLSFLPLVVRSPSLGVAKQPTTMHLSLARYNKFSKGSQH